MDFHETMFKLKKTLKLSELELVESVFPDQNCFMPMALDLEHIVLVDLRRPVSSYGETSTPSCLKRAFGRLKGVPRWVLQVNLCLDKEGVSLCDSYQIIR